MRALQREQISCSSSLTDATLSVFVVQVLNLLIGGKFNSHESFPTCTFSVFSILYHSNTVYSSHTCWGSSASGCTPLLRFSSGLHTRNLLPPCNRCDFQDVPRASPERLRLRRLHLLWPSPTHPPSKGIWRKTWSRLGKSKLSESTNYFAHVGKIIIFGFFLYVDGYLFVGIAKSCKLNSNQHVSLIFPLMLCTIRH